MNAKRPEPRVSTRRARRGALAAGLLAGMLALVPASAGSFPGTDGTIVFSSNRIVGDEPLQDPGDPASARVTDFEIYSVSALGNAVQLTNNTVMEASENGVTTVTAINDSHPVVSPDGTKIAFTRNFDPSDNSTDPDVFVMDIDGSDVVQVTKDKPGGSAGAMGASQYEPAWSPDGTRLAYRSSDGVEADIFVADLRTGVKTRLALDAGQTGMARYQSEPAWSPDGTEIAYSQNKGPETDVFAVNIASGAIRPIANEAGVGEGSPAWSPDGRYVAYRHGDDGSGAGIWKVALDTGVRTMLTDPLNGAPAPEEGDAAKVYSDLMPAWSPDGASIAFQSNRPDDGEGTVGDVDLYEMNVDGTGQTRLTASSISTTPPVIVGEAALPESDLTPDWQTVAAADLGLVIADQPDPVVLGGAVTETVTITNPGPSYAADVVATIGFTSGSLISATSPGVACTGSGPVVCAIGGLPVGRSATVVLRLRAEAVGSLALTASVTSSTPDPVGANNSATESTTVVAPPVVVQAVGPQSCAKATLRVRVLSRAHVHVRETTRVTLLVRNTSRVTATGVSAAYKVPSGFSLVSSSRTSVRAGQTLTFRWAAIKPGQEMKVTLRVRSRVATRQLHQTVTVRATCLTSPARTQAHIQGIR